MYIFTLCLCLSFLYPKISSATQKENSSQKLLIMFQYYTHVSHILCPIFLSVLLRKLDKINRIRINLSTLKRILVLFDTNFPGISKVWINSRKNNKRKRKIPYLWIFESKKSFQVLQQSFLQQCIQIIPWHTRVHQCWQF